MTRFFVHWAGRRERSRLRASERPGTASIAVPGAATGDEEMRAI
jgi:hypothetical protein